MQGISARLLVILNVLILDVILYILMFLEDMAAEEGDSNYDS